MSSQYPLRAIVERRAGEFTRGGALHTVFIVDILECGHEVWNDVCDPRHPYSITARRQCSGCKHGRPTSSLTETPEYAIR